VIIGVCGLSADYTIVFVSISIAMRRASARAQKDWLEAIQRRVAAIASALSNTKGIKMAGISEKVGDKLQSFRVDELRISGKFREVLGVSLAIGAASQVAIPVVTLIAFVYIGRANGKSSLNADSAFTALSLVSLLASPIQEIAKAAPHIAASIGCFQRIQEFVTSCEIAHRSSAGGGSPSAYKRTDHSLELHSVPILHRGAEKQILIAVDDADFAFGSMSDVVLHNITLSIAAGTWTVLIGPVGCGKSALLMALLNKLRPLRRSSTYRQPSLEIGYCAQEPWLPSLNIRKLITANTEFDESWYSTILDACALRPDLADLQAGDQTVVGSNGARLSGGQKQRLGLARALYSRKRLLILDDVMGGLDSKTEQTIADNLFGTDGLLRKNRTTVILATHSGE
jgi:ATP-binding cassette, subfamily C (CFTR/MRP), member 1